MDQTQCNYSESTSGFVVKDQQDLDYNSAVSNSPTGAEFGDSPCERNLEMGIEDTCENNWEVAENFPSVDTGLRVIALPPPPSYDLDIPSTNDSPNYNADLENLFSTDEQDEPSGPCDPGVCGLSNLRNTCFMNSGLQCLLNTPAMVQFFMKQLPEHNPPQEALIAHLTEVFHKVWSGRYSKFKPTEFHKALGTHHSQFKDYRQHDCQEFLALFLGSLHELLNTASSKSHVSDLSGGPMTPHSSCEEDRESLARAMLPENVETDSASQVALSITGLRCEASSSSHSSESSYGTSHIRMRPLPDDVRPFKSLQNDDSLLEKMEDDASLCQEDISPESTEEIKGNLIACNLLKRDAKVLNSPNKLKLEKNQTASLNNVSQCFRGYEDILKEAKTSNVNVLVTEQGPNNEIIFDSGKFPKHENTRRREPLENPNLTEFHNFDGKTVSVKRIKETNKLNDQMDGASEALELNLESATEFYSYNNKRFKLEENLEKEKNYRMECERKENNVVNLEQNNVGEFSGAMALNSSINVDDDLEADKHWEKHLGHNQSVIVDSFQGQFRSTVVCSECQYVSSTYEPFMYLSVPLPYAMEQQICITFVPANAEPPTKYLLTLNKQDKVIKIKEHLKKMMKGNNKMFFELAEVLHHHIARILDENHFIRYIGSSDPHRSIYAFEMNEDTGEPVEVCDNRKTYKNKGKMGAGDSDMVFGPKLEHEVSESPVKTDNTWKSCAICLEEVDKGLKNHRDCVCFLCESCIERSLKHYRGDVVGDFINCPVCNERADPEKDFTLVNDVNDFQTTTRVLKIPILFRQDTEGEGNNNEKCQKLFGHPHLIKVANRLKGSELYDIVSRFVPYNNKYNIILVDGQGYHCSRCMYTVHCKGCKILKDSDVCLQTGDNLAVRFTTPVTEILAIEHNSLLRLRKNEQLSIYDCLDAFSESETLDEHNPWYCPTCQRNQCATKTLTVWRYPDFLIVYLKRFVFHEYASVKLDNKVSFPLSGLNVMPSSRIQQGTSRPYNLYACVNHYGGASGGHYTSYAKNPLSGDWHLFNDDLVTKQKPQEEDFSHAYVLFYQKQGIHFDLNITKSLLDEASGKPNIDQIILDLDSSVEQDYSAYSYIN